MLGKQRWNSGIIRPLAALFISREEAVMTPEKIIDVGFKRVKAFVAVILVMAAVFFLPSVAMRNSGIEIIVSNAGNWTNNRAPFVNNVACLLKNNGELILIDTKGIYVVPLGEYYAEEIIMGEGFITVKKTEKYGVIDSGGNLVVPMIYDSVSAFHNGVAAVSIEGRFGAINTKGETIIPLEYELVGECSEGFISVKKNHCWGFFNTSGELVIPIEYYALSASGPVFSDGLACVLDGFLDTDGNLIQVDTETPIEVSSNFKEGLASVFYFAEGVGKQGFIDRSGRIVVPLEYERTAEDFNEGLAWVYKEGKYGFVNRKGKLVIPMEYDYAESFSCGLASVKKDGAYGYINRRGRMIAYGFDKADSFSEGYAWAVKNGIPVILQYKAYGKTKM